MPAHDRLVCGVLSAGLRHSQVAGLLHQFSRAAVVGVHAVPVTVHECEIGAGGPLPHVARSELHPGETHWVTLRERTLDLKVDVTGQVPQDVELVLLPDVRLGVLGAFRREPISLARKVDRGQARFHPLVPGPYALRWRSGKDLYGPIDFLRV